MGSTNALIHNLNLNTNRSFNCVNSRTKHSTSWQINQIKHPLSFPCKRQRKISKVVCFALEDVRDMQKRLGIGAPGAVVEDRPEVADDIQEDAVANSDLSDNGSVLYNFLYPDKELLPEDKEMTIFDHLEELRDRIFVSVLAVGAAIMGCFVYSKGLIMILEAPIRTQGVRFLQLAPG